MRKKSDRCFYRSFFCLSSNVCGEYHRLQDELRGASPEYE